ncbi:MAG: hypothetical protein KDE26_14860, partial [Bacteroidetes bacterium]|nr:hypothetical protein [Bacteroidota bacterium]
MTKLFSNLMMATVMVGLFIFMPSDLEAQRKKRNTKEDTPKVETTSYDESLYNGLTWRSIGPFRGGRSAAVTGVPG